MTHCQARKGRARYDRPYADRPDLKLAEARELYQSEGWPALSRHGDKLVGYFIGDVGAVNQIVHLWKCADDADRRRFWETVFADEAFMAFARKLRPLFQTQENKLLLAAPWGPHP